MKKRVIVDRIEGDIAVCEDETGKMLELPLADLPRNVREGDVLSSADGTYHIDVDETRRRRCRNAALQAELFEP